MADTIHVAVLIKGAERYIFRFTDASRPDVYRACGRCAMNPDLSFTWFDAAKLIQSIRDAKPSRIS